MKPQRLILLTSALFCALAAGLCAQSAPSSAPAGGATRITRAPSSVQSSNLPGGLSLVGQVQEAGSDARAADFQTNTLPDTEPYPSQPFSTTAQANPSTLVTLSPANLQLLTDYDARVYFVGETTDSHSALGFRTFDTATGTYSTTQLIFPDATSPVTNYDGDYSGLSRSIFEPLLPGDFVDLGTISAGQRLDFTLLVDAINGGTTQWWSQPGLNSDGLQHMVAYARPNSPYLMIGFEETSATSGDFIDLIFAIDIGTENVAALLAAPEPAAATTLALLLLLATTVATRQRPRQAA